MQVWSRNSNSCFLTDGCIYCYFPRLPNKLLCNEDKRNLLIKKLLKELEIADEISKALAKYKILVSYSDLVITDSVVTDTLIKEKTCTFTGENLEVTNLSEIIIDALFKRVNDICVYHYTSREVAENILNTENFRLYNISKRQNEGEVITFCKTHNLSGYLDKDEFGVMNYKKIMMPSTYYASFTSAKLTEEKDNYLWSTFATYNGVRIKIRIHSDKHKRTDVFRSIHYERCDSAPIPLLMELSRIAKKYNKNFMLQGISTICSYYLPHEYEIEDEYRVLHRNLDERKMKTYKDHKGLEYIEIPLGKENMSGYFFEIVEITYTDDIKIPETYNSLTNKRKA